MRPADVPVVILCGGLGTRLREETETRPKPMVEIGHAPILWHIMKIYGHHGFRKFVLCLGYKGHVVKQFFREFEIWGKDFTMEFSPDGGRIEHRNTRPGEPWEVTLCETGPDTMTGGRIFRIQQYIKNDVFMATYGDGVGDVDVAAELRFHLAHGKAATLTAINPPSRFGVLDLGDDDQVSRFREEAQHDNWVNGGFYVFHRRVFDYLDPDCVLEQSPLERMSADGELMAMRHHGCWYPMDTYRDYQELNRLWAEGRAGWKIWEL
jgi:glucose-1-phosphate cytidylyltransferase